MPLGSVGSILIVWVGMVMPSHLLSIWTYTYDIWDVTYPIRTYEPQTLAIGAIISLIYFGYKKMKSRKFSKPLLIGIGLMFLAVASIYGFVYYSLYININFLAYHEDFFSVCFKLLFAFFLFSAIASVFLAKLYDRRWRVVFILALIGTAICLDLVQLASWHAFAVDWPNMNLFNIFYDRNNPDYIFSNHWGSNINAIDEIFIGFSWYTVVGSCLALIGLL